MRLLAVTRAPISAGSGAARWPDRRAEEQV